MEAPIQNTINLLRALGDDTRFKILQMLAEHEICVRALAHRIGCSEASVSQHLKILREAGLVRGEKKGYWTHYSLCKENFFLLIDTIQGLIMEKEEAAEP
jgi:ArsR family transcriptional regulator